MLKRICFTLILFFIGWGATAQDIHLTLWDNHTAPSSNGISDGSEFEPKPGKLGNTTSAELWIYKPDSQKATGQAVIFCPGGGYKTIAIGTGFQIAKWYAEHGIVGAVLKYRIPNGHPEVPSDDLQKAIRTIRSMSDELGIDPHKVGVSGGSAGGHLAGTAGILFEEKPDFMVLLFPVVSSKEELWHRGSFVNLLGEQKLDSLRGNYSLEERVNSTACPALIFHSSNDQVVPAENSAILYTRLMQKGVDASLHIYPSGGHGWGMRENFRYHIAHLEAILDWLAYLNEKKADRLTRREEAPLSGR